MKVKHVVITREDNSSVEFFLPGMLDDDLIKEYIRSIRMGDQRRWEREFRKLPLVITKKDSAIFDTEMKYIVLGDKKKPEFDEIMVIFPKCVDHDRFGEVMQMLMMEHGMLGDDKYLPTKMLSAGFVWDTGSCHGRSETLNIASRKEDNILYKKWFN